MSNNEKRSLGSGGMGVGYVSLVMIFSVICLTVLAVLSYQAAGANDILNRKSGDFTAEYYEADSNAKNILMQLDEAALQVSAGFFEEDFTCVCNEILDTAKISASPEGVEVSFTQPINDRLNLDIRIMFYSNSVDGSRYRILQWNTASADTAETEEPLGVWDGSMFN